MIVPNNSIQFGERTISYTVKRSPRKTVGIVVEPDGSVIIKAPPKLDEERIKQIVLKKRNWIAEKIKKTKEIKKPVPLKHELVSGERVPIKNRFYRLKIRPIPTKRTRVSFTFGIITVYVNEDLSLKERETEIEKTLVKWYKVQAKKIINERLKKYLKYVEQEPRDIKVRNQKLRWGTCTSDGALIFNWRIAMAPVSAIDYIVVHELCHLRESPHTARFWDMVESLFPAYKKWKEWLRINGPSLDLRL